MILKGTISAVTSGVRRVATFATRFTKYGAKPFIQQSGFSSRPNDGDEAIMVRLGDAMVVISSEDTQNPIALEKGERAMHMDAGNFVHIKKEASGTIQIKAGGKVKLDAGTIEIGAGVLEKIIMGEQFQTLFVAHFHTSAAPGSPTSGPMTLIGTPPAPGPVTAIPLSSVAKVGP
jgi:phage gp45-like